MGNLRQYMLSLVCTALMCSILIRIAKNTINVELIKLLCGLFLLLCLLSPFYQTDFATITEGAFSYTEDAHIAVEEGKTLASDMMLQGITEELKAYILSKAEEMDLALSVEISLDPRGIPIAVILHGSAKPHQKEHIAHILQSDLGIPKENQTWTG